MQTIHQTTFTAIDFESAGNSRGATDIPVQIGISQWGPAKDEKRHFDSYLQCDQEISWQAQKIHGITNEDLVDAPKLVMLWPTLKKFLGSSIIVAHGKGTEKRFLRAFPAHGFGPWIDTLLLFRAAFPDLPKHNLGFLCDHFGLSSQIEYHIPKRQWHDALFDAAASISLLEFFIEHFELQDAACDVLLQPDTSIWHRNRR